MNNDNTFTLTRTLLGDGRGTTATLACTFAGSRVDLAFGDTSGLKAELHGTVEE